MTNYNERLDDVVSLIGVPLPIEQAIHAKDTAKQALTSLIKELVAEAKPNGYQPKGHQLEACFNHEKYTSQCCACQRQRARVNVLDEFEQNLLKALEEK